MNQAVITQFKGRQFLLIYEEGVLAECHPLPEEGSIRVGDIYIGRVEKVVKNINSAFIRLDCDHTGYLPLDGEPAFMLNRFLPKGLPSIAESDKILVQITQEPQKAKQARVTGNISLGGKYIALNLKNRAIGVSKKITDKTKSAELKRLLLEREKEGVPSFSGICLPRMDFFTGVDFPEEKDKVLLPGCIFRTACEQAENEEIISEYESLCESLETLLNRAFYEKSTGCIWKGESEYLAILKEYGLDRIDEVKTDLPEVAETLKTVWGQVVLYEEKEDSLSRQLGLETELRRLSGKKVWLKSGGFLIIEPTEAMVVIDVNSGKSVGRKNKARHILETNLEAACEITRQLRLRNLSGIIMIDFINMESDEDKNKLVSCLQQGLKQDKVPAYFIDITGLELYELTRKKVRRPLHEALEGLLY